MLAARTGLASIALALAAGVAGCETPGLPGFANPPPYDAGAADDDGGPNAQDAGHR
jgi:hypothetical protein